MSCGTTAFMRTIWYIRRAWRWSISGSGSARPSVRLRRSMRCVLRIRNGSSPTIALYMRLRLRPPASDSSCNRRSVSVSFLSSDAKTSVPCLWDKDSSFCSALTRRADSTGMSLKGLSSPLIQNAYGYEIRLGVDLYGAGDVWRVTEFGELGTDGVERFGFVLRELQ